MIFGYYVGKQHEHNCIFERSIQLNHLECVWWEQHEKVDKQEPVDLVQVRSDIDMDESAGMEMEINGQGGDI